MPDWIPVLASVVVGVVLIVAGASKIAAGPEWPAQARELGAPTFTIAAVPWIEIAIGAALVVQIGAPTPAIAATAMLMVFTVMIVLQLAQGRRPPCACFGAWSAKPLGAGHVIRNLALIGLSVVACF